MEQDRASQGLKRRSAIAPILLWEIARCDHGGKDWRLGGMETFGDGEVVSRILSRKKSHNFQGQQKQGRKKWSGDRSQSRGHQADETIPRWELSPAAGI
ncbi:hypothetical protein ASPBRDRAFT_48407 [Aspergillus brasiliensis CBS 101740]|uniref:Uncharacterized protein n=1 Tax=Aspergillus brasiliensis (strain CBS 101740 / IMI 381727 / IBT 21946) TaxID=767769 RepID=A0A1L9U5C1_ASPBC|nr:hypothetical protein ASPBRDRAFT_48407 [Aspergillus brasiliensis CBS 101740]